MLGLRSTHFIIGKLLVFKRFLVPNKRSLAIDLPDTIQLCRNVFAIIRVIISLPIALTNSWPHHTFEIIDGLLLFCLYIIITFLKRRNISLKFSFLLLFFLIYPLFIFCNTLIFVSNIAIIKVRTIAVIEVATGFICVVRIFEFLIRRCR